MLDYFVDYLYYLSGYKGKCYSCSYKNKPVYRCPNPECKKVYCLDCWNDSTLKFVCKKCQIYEYD